MSNSGGVISAPVDVKRDIAGVLGVQSGDVGELCQSAAINPWSKRKPVERAGRHPATLAELAAIHYGFDLNPRSAYELYSGGYNGFHWDYTKPTTWFRVLDFDGYKHNATRPTVSFSVSTPYINRPTYISFLFTGDGSDITIEDMEYPTRSTGTNVDEALGDWNVVFLIYIQGRVAQLYNTGLTLSDCVGASPVSVDIASAIRTTDKGKTAAFMPALAYQNADMTVGLHDMDSATFMQSYYILPLNFTSSMESVVTATIAEYQMLVDPWIYFTDYYPITTGHLYYALTYLNALALDNVTGTDTLQFKARLLLTRSGSVYECVPSVTETITGVHTLNNEYWSFSMNSDHEVVLGDHFTDGSNPVFPQAGDTISIEITVYHNGMSQTFSDIVTTI